MKRREAGVTKKPLDRQIADGSSARRIHLIHVTSVGCGREIIEQGVLEAKYCKHFEKNLLYFFVDRPGYKLRGSEEKSDQINRFPFVFISKIENNMTPHHVFPFDTGAALSGMFDDKADPFVPLDDYELGNSIAGINAHMQWAFDSRFDYFDGRIRGELAETLNPWNSIEKSFLDIAAMASPTHNRPDKRASAIEVAFSNNIHLSSQHFTAIIPKQLIENNGNTNTKILEDMNKYKVQWEHYDWLPNKTPADFFEEIQNITWDIINGPF